MKARKSHIFDREKHDHYVEPLLLDEALIDHIAPYIDRRVILDPCCGWARIPRAAASRGFTAIGCDLVPRWLDSPDGPLPGNVHCFEIDGLLEMERSTLAQDVGAIVMNPPYKQAERFVRAALFSNVPLVAAILPLTWMAGARRSAWLEDSGLSWVLPIVPRPSMPTGKHIADGGVVGGGSKDFAVFVWYRFARLPETTVEWLNWRKATAAEMEGEE